MPPRLSSTTWMTCIGRMSWWCTICAWSSSMVAVWNKEQDQWNLYHEVFMPQDLVHPQERKHQRRNIMKRSGCEGNLSSEFTTWPAYSISGEFCMKMFICILLAMWKSMPEFWKISENDLKGNWRGSILTGSTRVTVECWAASGCKLTTASRYSGSAFRKCGRDRSRGMWKWSTV